MWSALFVWDASDLFKLVFAGASAIAIVGITRDLFMAGFDFTIKTILYKKAVRNAKNQTKNVTYSEGN